MAKFSHVVEYALKTTYDAAGITKLERDLSRVQTELTKLMQLPNTKVEMKGLDQSIKDVEKLKTALMSAFNTDIGMLDMRRFQSEISKAKISVEGLQKAFKTSGVAGQQSFAALTAKIASFDSGMKSISTTTQKVFNTFANTVRWGVTASIFETMNNDLRRAVEYVQELDSSLNAIRIVSGENAEYMRDFAKQATEAASALGKTTTDFTNASLIYIQQGKNIQEANKLAELTLKTANVTGQETSEVSEQLTSLMNGYQIAVDDMEASVDKLAKVAAVGASDLEELATAESKVASTANALGVSQDQLVAQLSTIISVTRQAPESVGNAMKTIYARLGDLQLGETLEDGTSIGTIGKALKAVGIDIQTATGDLRDMGDVIEELMGKWNTLNTAEKQALAVKLAGKYQYNNLMALLENSQMYYNQLEASENSLGTINEQEEIYLDSISAKMAQMQAEFEGLINNLFNPDDLKPFMDGLTKIIGQVSSFVASVGGGGTLATGIGGLALSVFSSDIARGITNVQRNYERRRTINQNFDATPELVKEFGASAGDIAKDSATYQYAARMSPYASMFNEKELEAYRTTLHEIYTQESARAENLAKMNELADQLNHEYQTNLQTTEKIAVVENGRINVDQKRLGELYDSGFNMSSDDIKAQKDAARDLMLKTTSYKDYVENTLDEIEKNGYTKQANGWAGTATRNLRASVAEFTKSDDPTIRQLAEQISAMNTQGLKTESGRKTWNDKITELIRAIDKFAKEVDESQRTNAKEKKQNATDAVEKYNSDGEMLEEGQKANLQLGQNKEIEASNRRVLQSYLDLTGGVVQLTSAWEALKGLGSVWTDDDLSFADKLFMSLQNLIPTIMMLVNAFQTMNEAKAVIQEEQAKQERLNAEATAANTVANDANTESLERNVAARQADVETTSVDTRETKENTESTAANTAANAVEDRVGSGSATVAAGSKAGKKGALKKAGQTGGRIIGKAVGAASKFGTKFLPGIGEALIVFDVISAISSAASDAAKKAKQAEEDARQEKLDSSKTLLDDTESTYNQMKSLQEEYHDSGEASSSFIDSLKTLGDQFGIQETDALLAAGAYDTLASMVSKARDEAEKEWIATTFEQAESQKTDAYSAISAYAEEQASARVFKWGDILTSLYHVVQDIYISLSDGIVGQTFTALKNFFTNILGSAGDVMDKLINAPGEILGDIMLAIANTFDSVRNMPLIGEKMGELADWFLEQGAGAYGLTAEQVKEARETYYKEGREAAAQNAREAKTEEMQQQIDGTEKNLEYVRGQIKIAEEEEARAISYKGAAAALVAAEVKKRNAASDDVQEAQKNLRAAKRTQSANETNYNNAIMRRDNDEDQSLKTFRSSYLLDENNVLTYILGNIAGLTKEQIASLQNGSITMLPSTVELINQTAGTDLVIPIDALDILKEQWDETITNGFENLQKTGKTDQFELHDFGFSDEDNLWLSKYLFVRSAINPDYTMEDMAKDLIASAGGTPRYRLNTDAVYTAAANTVDDTAALYSAHRIVNENDARIISQYENGGRESDEQAVADAEEALDTAQAVLDIEQANVNAMTGLYNRADESLNNITGNEDGLYNLRAQEVALERSLNTLNTNLIPYSVAAGIAAVDEYDKNYSYLNAVQLARVSQDSGSPDNNPDVSGDSKSETDSENGNELGIKSIWDVFGLLGIDKTSSTGDLDAAISTDQDLAVLAAGTASLNGRDNAENAGSAIAAMNNAAMDFAKAGKQLEDLGKNGDPAAIREARASQNSAALGLIENLPDAEEELSQLISDLQDQLKDENLDAQTRTFLENTLAEAQESLSNVQKLEDETQDYLNSIKDASDKSIQSMVSNGLLNGIDNPQKLIDTIVKYTEYTYGAEAAEDTYAYLTTMLKNGGTAEELAYLAEQARAAGDAILGAHFERLSYEAPDGGKYANLFGVTKNMDDDDALTFYRSLDSWSVEHSRDIDQGTVTAVVQKVLEAGGDWKDAVEFMKSGLVDIGRVVDGYLPAINAIFGEGGSFQPWYNDRLHEQYKTGVSAIADANLNDEDITVEMLGDIGLDDDFVDMLTEAGGQSSALNDLGSLIASKNPVTQLDFSDLADSYQQYDYREQIDDLEKMNDEADELRQTISGFNDEGVQINISDKEIDAAKDKLEDLENQIDDKKFEIQINVVGDVLDDADRLLEIMDDTQDAIDLINSDYLIDEDSAQALVSVFPDILDGCKAAGDGMIQLNKDVADASIASANAQIEAAFASDSAKLESAINYAGAMQAQCEAEAEMYSRMAEDEATTDSDLLTAKQENDDAYAQIQAENLQFVGEQQMDALNTAVENDANAQETQIDNSQEASDAAIYNLGAIGEQSGKVAAQVITNARSMWEAVNSIGSDSFKSGFFSSVPQQTSTISASVNHSADLSAPSVDTTAPSHDTGKTEQQQEAQKRADAAALRAELWNQIQGQLQARLAVAGSKMSGLKNGVKQDSDSGSGSGGGGGDGSGSSYEPKTKEEIEDEIDRYEKVQTLLDAITADYEKLNSEAERLAGYDYADNLTEQIKLLRQQIDLQKQKLEIQKEEAKEYAEQLKTGYGIQINEEGFIQNYAERYKAMLNDLNGLVAMYNAETTEDGQEALEEQISNAQSSFDEFNDLIDKYDELVSSSIKDTQQQLEDLEDTIEDLNISAFQKAVDAADNIKDLNEALIEFNQAFSGRQSDDPFRAMETSVGKLAGYFDVANDSANEYYDTLIGRYKQLMSAAGVTDAQKKFYQSQINAVESARKQVGAGTMEEFGTGYLDLSLASVEEMLSQIDQFQKTGTSSIFGKDSADLYDTAKTVFDQATSLISDYEGEIDDLRSSIVDAIDDVGDRMDERITQLENVDDELQHISDIVELLHGDQSYDQLNQVLAARNQNYQQQITETQQQLEYWQDLIKVMKEGSDEYKAVQEKIADTQSKLNDLVKDSLETIQQQYTNTVNKITSQWTKNALGNDLDWISQEWELINRNADYYLDDVNKAYNIQKLQSKYLDLLDGSNTLDVQQKITAQMNQQLGYLRDKAKLSEYDVAYAEAQLEILQKQIALQEAQANKSQMKLRRDSQGNYNYVYTADEGDVRSAQGDLLDAQNNAYNLSKDQMKQTQADSISALQDAMSLISDIWTNANLSLEEKQERTRTVIDSLKEYLAGTSEQLSTSQQNIINDFIGMCDTLLDENKGSMKDVYDQIIAGNDDAFSQIDRRWQTSISDWLQHMDQFNSDTNDMFSNLVDNANDYQDSVDKIADLVKADFDDISDAIQNCTDKTKDLAASNADFINQLKNDSGVIKDYESRLQEYADKIGDAQNSMRAYQQQVNELQSKLTAKEQENSNLSGQIQDLYNQLHPNGTGGNGNGNGSSGNGGSGGGFGGTDYSDNELALGIAQSIWTYKNNGWGDDPLRSSKLTSAYGFDFAVAVQRVINDYYYSGRTNELVNYDSSRFSSYNLIGYDTGGYTGEWSDGSGKLALLHSKEIVLNANDTENILKAVDAVRSMTADMKGSIFGSVMSGTAEQLANALATSMSENIEQTVNVHAEFPNATQAEDIRMAILGLADRASQYAHSRR